LSDAKAIALRRWCLAGGLAMAVVCVWMLTGAVSTWPQRSGLFLPLGPGYACAGAIIAGLLSVLLLNQSAKPGTTAGGGWSLWSVLALCAVMMYVLAVLALMFADLLYMPIQEVYSAMTERQAVRYDSAGNAVEFLYPVLHALKLSLVTSGATLLLVLVWGVPIGYALSRFRFPGQALVNMLVDLPMVIPPLIIGVSLLVFFQAPAGRWISGTIFEFVFTVPGIVLCQFFCSASFGIRACTAAFNAVDVRLELLAMTLGCSRAVAVRRVVLPQARGGLLAGGIIAWAHAIGLFAPLQVFAGAVPGKTAVLPTTIFLELSNGRIERALAVSMIMLVFSGLALLMVHILAPNRPRGRA
jgi:molybdate transport system permease protein